MHRKFSGCLSWMETLLMETIHCQIIATIFVNCRLMLLLVHWKSGIVGDPLPHRKSPCHSRHFRRRHWRPKHGWLSLLIYDVAIIGANRPLRIIINIIISYCLRHWWRLRVHLLLWGGGRHCGGVAVRQSTLLLTYFRVSQFGLNF